MNQSPSILALDFDGVICNGLREYFQSSLRTYQRLWFSPSIEELNHYENCFYQVRPVIETGWEMPLLIRAMVKGFNNENILDHWGEICKDLMQEDCLEKSQLMAELDQVRDDWISSDLQRWLGLHQFYEGVIPQLKRILDSDTLLYIITTKEGRFVKELLHNQGVKISEDFIYGKEVKQGKDKILEGLLSKYKINSDQIWFVEDLLKTLNKIKDNQNLQGMGLYLAAWGYNTYQVRESLKNQSRIQLLTLDQFTQGFIAW